MYAKRLGEIEDDQRDKTKQGGGHYDLCAFHHVLNDGSENRALAFAASMVA